MTESVETKLKKFLNLYWLRPENALITTFKSKAIEEFSVDSPSLDISCGDGLFMFLHLGGSFEPDFDYFKNTSSKNFSHEKFIDIYDCYDESYNVPILNFPNQKFDFGTDWKQTLLDKSIKLDLYKNLILHDNNKKPLPFSDGYFKLIHSNSIYWIKHPEILLSEIHRILSDEGVAILEVMTPWHFSTFKKLSIFSEKAIEILDRKRRETMPGLKDYEEWKKIIENEGFKIIDVKNIFPNKVVIDFWNIGLRPISHLLIQMSESLSKKDRLRIKSQWVDIFFELFKPLIELDTNYDFKESPYLLFVLKK